MPVALQQGNLVVHNDADIPDCIAVAINMGEMNPDQLWETTMDPESRQMLLVNIEDAVEVDDVFSTLMGEVVAPRKSFIAAHARSVQNLDV